MKSLLKIAVYPAWGVILFVLSLVIILAARGKLNAEGLRGVPFLGGAAEGRGSRGPGGSLPTVATMRSFSSEELSGMLKEARAAKQKVEAEAARLSQQEARIGMLLRDLAKEKEEILKIRAELDVKHGELKKAQAELDKRLIEADETEIAGLRRSAAIHEAMDPKKAAAAIAALEPTHAAKLLAFVQEKKAARILQEMTPQAASALLSLVKKVSVDTGEE